MNLFGLHPNTFPARQIRFVIASCSLLGLLGQILTMPGAGPYTGTQMPTMLPASIMGS